MRDEINNVTYNELIELVHVGGEKQFIRSSAAISQRAQKQVKPEKTRYLPTHSGDTRNTPINPQPAKVTPPTVEKSPQTRKKEEPHPWLVREPLIIPSVQNMDQNKGAIPKTTRSITKQSSKAGEEVVRCVKCDWSMPVSKYENHMTIYHTKDVNCPMCYKRVPYKDLDRHIDAHLDPPTTHQCRKCGLITPIRDAAEHAVTHSPTDGSVE